MQKNVGFWDHIPDVMTIRKLSNLQFWYFELNVGISDNLNNLPEHINSIASVRCFTSHLKT